MRARSASTWSTGASEPWLVGRPPALPAGGSAWPATDAAGWPDSAAPCRRVPRRDRARQPIREPGPGAVATLAVRAPTGRSGGFGPGTGSIASPGTALGTRAGWLVRRRAVRRWRRGISGIGRPRSRQTAVRDQAPELARAIEPDEDLAEQPLAGGGLAAGLQALDRHLDDRVPDIGRRERAAIEPLGRARRGRLPGTRSGSPEPPAIGSSATLARVRGPGGTTAPGGTSSTTPNASSSPSPSPSRAERSRKPAPTPPSAAATSASGPPSTRWTTWPSRAIDGSTEASERARAAACQPQGARIGWPDRAASGSPAAASAPIVQAVAQ